MKKIDVKLPQDWEFIPMEEFYDETAPMGAQIVAARPKGEHSPCFWIAMYVTPQGSNAEREIQRLSEAFDCEPIETEFWGLEGFVCMVHDFPREIDYYFLEKEEYTLVVKVDSEMWDSDGITGWISENTHLDKELKNANGNMHDGKPIIVPPALLSQKVSFTEDDYMVTQMFSPFIGEFFDFIVANSLRPAKNAAELISLTEWDYDCHGGIRKIDHTRLSEAAQKKLTPYPHLYIGKSKARVSKGRLVMTLVIIKDFLASPIAYAFPVEGFYESVSGFIEKNDSF